jgi:hypothetical protein
MKREFPAHPLWTDPIFERDDYQVFAKDVELSLLEIEEPEEVRIRKTLPAIAERLSVLHQSLTRDINEWGVKTKEQLANINATLGDLFEGRVSLTLHSTRTAIQPITATATATANVTTTTPSTTTAFTTFIPPTAPTPVSTTTSFHSAQTSPLLSNITLPLPDVSLSSQLELHSSSSVIDNNCIAPQYLLSRTISTVPQLWREWTVGLKGGPSVQGLEDLYGPRWRSMHKESVLYGRRKVIIDEIRQQHTKGMSIGAAVENVELMRQRAGMSLHQLYLLLNGHKKDCRESG